MDLIDRQDLISHLNDCLAEKYDRPYITDAVTIAIKCFVEQMPTVEPKRGECDTCGYHNSCHWEIIMQDWGVEHRYCAAYHVYCGADMRGEE